MFSHHAYLIEGREEAAETARAFVREQLGIGPSVHPDFLDIMHETFGVDESRELKELSTRASIGERKAILIFADIFTREAQNALLKIFEDPTPHTHFFVVTPYPRALLPTLLSRMEILVLSKDNQTKESEEAVLAKKVREGTTRERFQIIEELLAEEDKMKAVRFLEALTELLEKELRKGDVKGMEQAFLVASRASSYARDRGASLKQLLEYAILSIPEK